MRVLVLALRLALAPALAPALALVLAPVLAPAPAQMSRVGFGLWLELALAQVRKSTQALE